MTYTAVFMDGPKQGTFIHTNTLRQEYYFPVKKKLSFSTVDPDTVPSISEKLVYRAAFRSIDDNKKTILYSLSGSPDFVLGSCRRVVYPEYPETAHYLGGVAVQRKRDE